MSKIAIRVEGLSKKYTLQHRVTREGLRHAVQNAITAPFRKLRSGFRHPVSVSPLSSSVSSPPAHSDSASEEFWALRDVSFEIERGEVIGIIGRNGAGKSTLLKILSRITEPTSGRVEIEGRVASLLEVGTGFHPELTGRENIFLNGAILGMGRAEVRRKFDEIAAFAEVERFLDTPVKRYSSGMYVRLAFAVAAHLEPEILIVDEVLAVGDAEFQKKCLGKMEDVSRTGRTVLFVSHNIAAVKRLCRSALLMRQGQLQAIGPVDSVLKNYVYSPANPSRAEVAEEMRIKGSRRAILEKVQVIGPDAGVSHVEMGHAFAIRLTYSSLAPSVKGTFFILINTADGSCLCSAFQKDCEPDAPTLRRGGAIEAIFDDNYFCPGSYRISCGILDETGGFHDWVETDQILEIVPTSSGRPFDHRLGRLSLQATWKSLR